MGYPIGQNLAVAGGLGRGFRDASHSIAEALLRKKMMEREDAQRAQKDEFERAVAGANLMRDVGSPYAGYDFGVGAPETFRGPTQQAMTGPWREAARGVAAGEEPTFRATAPLRSALESSGLPSRPRPAPIVGGGERYERFGEATAPGGAMAGMAEPTAAGVEQGAQTARTAALRRAALEYMQPFFSTLEKGPLGPHVSAEGAALYALGGKPPPPTTRHITEVRGGTTRDSTYRTQYDPARTALVTGLFRMMGQSGTHRIRRADLAQRVRASAATRFPPPSPEEVEREVQDVLGLLPAAADYGIEDLQPLAAAFGVPMNMPVPGLGGGGGSRATTTRTDRGETGAAAGDDDFFSE